MYEIEHLPRYLKIFSKLETNFKTYDFKKRHKRLRKIIVLIVECRVTFYTAMAIMRPLNNPCPLIEKILQLPHC